MLTACCAKVECFYIDSKSVGHSFCTPLLTDANDDTCMTRAGTSVQRCMSPLTSCKSTMPVGSDAENGPCEDVGGTCCDIVLSWWSASVSAQNSARGGIMTRGKGGADQVH